MFPVTFQWIELFFFMPVLMIHYVRLHCSELQIVNIHNTEVLTYVESLNVVEGDVSHGIHVVYGLQYLFSLKFLTVLMGRGVLNLSAFFKNLFQSQN